MKKLFTLLVLVAFAALSFGQKPEAVIQKSMEAPSVDGEVDDLWEDVEKYNIDLNFADEEPTLGSSGETYWQAVWVPDDGIYILVTVADDEWLTVYESGAGATYEYDKPEIYFDCNLVLEDGGGASGGPANGHHQIASWADDESYINGGAFEDADDPGVLYSFKVKDDANYVAEYYVPYDYLVDENGLVAEISGEMGFDVTVIDRDTDDAARKRAVWANTGDQGESWNNMDDCGTITFEGAEPPIYIDDFTAEGGEIAVNNGAFKIPITVDPPDANEGLKYVIDNDAGGRAPIATIDGTGMVSAKQNGTVTVTITTASDVVTKKVDVVISNQVVTLGDINLIRNGFFDEYDPEDLSPMEWGGTDGDIPPYVDEGFVTLDPAAPAEDAAPWSFQFGQSKFGCNSTDTYTFSFDAWADAVRNFYVDFEDPNNEYNRYGVSTSDLVLTDASEWFDAAWTGNSMWTFDLTTEPTNYEFDLVFTHMAENTAEDLKFMLGLADERVFLDNIILINDLDKDLIEEYVAVTEITVSGADGASYVPRGGTLQMSADVLPADADYQDVIWSVVPGTGYASIDADGLLTGDSTGMVTVVAMASDDSKVTGDLEVEVGFPQGIPQNKLNTLKVYPNPAVNELVVELTTENSRVTIYNAVGAKMEEVRVSGSLHRFDISEYASGIYFVKTGELVARFVK